jgi:hypothetical protein
MVDAAGNQKHLRQMRQQDAAKIAGHHFILQTCQKVILSFSAFRPKPHFLTCIKVGFTQVIARCIMTLLPINCRVKRFEN